MAVACLSLGTQLQVPANYNSMMFHREDSCMLGTSMQLQVSCPDCNCKSSTQLQLCIVLSGRDNCMSDTSHATASVALGCNCMPSTWLQLCGILSERQLHVHHYACNCKYRPRLQLHVRNAVADLWCLVKGTGAVACLPLGIQLQV